VNSSSRTVPQTEQPASHNPSFMRTVGLTAGASSGRDLCPDVSPSMDCYDRRVGSGSGGLGPGSGRGPGAGSGSGPGGCGDVGSGDPGAGPGDVGSGESGPVGPGSGGNGSGSGSGGIVTGSPNPAPASEGRKFQTTTPWVQATEPGCPDQSGLGTEVRGGCRCIGPSGLLKRDQSRAFHFLGNGTVLQRTTWPGRCLPGRADISCVWDLRHQLSCLLLDWLLGEDRCRRLLGATVIVPLGPISGG
jgi:hypothetical protein